MIPNWRHYNLVDIGIMEQMLRDSYYVDMLRMATRKMKKQESAIADLKGRPGASRANLFKRKRRAVSR